MKPKIHNLIVIAALILIPLAAFTSFTLKNPDLEIRSPESGRFLYVAVPGIRNYLGYGGHGILVFDMDNHHRFVKRIPMQGYLPNGKPSNVKGVSRPNSL